MLARVRIIGDGTQRNPYRVPLPTYTEVLTLIDQGVAYVIIPDETHPNLHEHDSAKVEATGHGPMLVELDEAGHEVWHDFLAEKYVDGDKKFKPELA